MATTQSRRTPSGGVLKRLLVGRAMSSHRLEHTLLPKILALPVFSSDALSSVAYATGEILLVLLMASATGQSWVMPISIAIATLMAIVVISYRQTVRAYPSGGGAYIVSKDNLGVIPGLIAAAALLVDYMMTVIVSIVAGVFAIVSAVPSLSQHRVALSIGFVIFMMLANLRGVRESGTLFAIPTYGFIVAILFMVGLGLVRCAGGCPSVYEPAVPVEGLATAATAVGLWSILRAFSSGATALTGVEAISNGVPAFRRPQARNAAETLAMMGTIAITMFLGISWLATHISGITASDETSVVAQIAMTVFDKGLLFYLVQAFTAAILVLAANTAYQDFPRLSAILARDRFMPRQFMNRGDRLVFSNGVIVLSAVSCLMIYAFDANLNRLIQLYVVGVFTSFTLSQTGMVRHWLKEKHKGLEAEKGWKRSIVINIVGAVTTGVVLIVTISAKFTHGAWLSILMMAAIVPTLLSIHRHYESTSRQLRGGTVTPGALGTNRVVLLVDGLTPAVAEAVGYVRSFRPTDLRVLYTGAGGVTTELREQWRRFSMGASELEELPGEGPLLDRARRYVRSIPRGGDDFITLVVPEMVLGRLSFYLVRSRELVRLKAGMLREPNVVVTDVPVAAETGQPVGVDGRPLIPQRIVTLVFVASVNDATMRAVNYAMSLGAAETRAVYFDLDPESPVKVWDEWATKGLPVPLDVVEAPFRDMTGPMLDEVRRYTARVDTVCAVVIPEFLVPKWRYLLLHNQNALFVKRLFLPEPRVILTSVPFPLLPHKQARDFEAVGF
jgi:amino acid transporter